jgi:hypothetical protein
VAVGDSGEVRGHRRRLQDQVHLSQFDADATALYFGTEWTPAEDGTGTPIPGVYVLNLESTPELAERALLVEWSDGAVTNRLIIPRGMVSEREGLKLTRVDSQTLGVTLDALDSGGSLGYILTNADMSAA